MVRRAPVSSESLASVGYDSASGILEIEFASGEVYRYFNVPASVHRALLDAESLGRYFTANIRTKYRYLRLGRSSAAERKAVSARAGGGTSKL